MASIKKFVYICVVKVLGSWNLPVENLTQLCCVHRRTCCRSSFRAAHCGAGDLYITSYANIQFSNRPQTN